MRQQCGNNTPRLAPSIKTKTRPLDIFSNIIARDIGLMFGALLSDCLAQCLTQCPMSKTQFLIL
jgi:hypothetical protein